MVIAMRRPAVVATLAVAGTSLLVVLAVWAALIGPQQVFTGDGPEKRPESWSWTATVPVTSPRASVSCPVPVMRPRPSPRAS